MDSASAFADLTREYCDIVDRAGALGRNEFLELIEPLVARLYASAAELPPVVLEGEDFEIALEVTLTLKQLEALFADRDIFRVVFDPWSNDEPVHSSLAECLAEIYKDLREGLAAFEAGHPHQAVWEWHEGWEIHWGPARLGGSGRHAVASHRIADVDLGLGRSSP
jgi:hypothetical protein